VVATGYVNGIAQGTGTLSAPSSITSARLGSRNGGASNFTACQLDHLYAYEKALDSALALWLSAEPYAMLRPIVRRRYFVPAAVGGVTYPRLERSIRGLNRGLTVGMR
jgi:hypothetical protein